MNDSGKEVEDVVVHIGNIMDTLRMDLTTPVQTRPRPACKNRINRSLADFAAATVEPHASRESKSILNGEVAST